MTTKQNERLAQLAALAEKENELLRARIEELTKTNNETLADLVALKWKYKAAKERDIALLALAGAASLWLLADAFIRVATFVALHS